MIKRNDFVRTFSKKVRFLPQTFQLNGKGECDMKWNLKKLTALALTGILLTGLSACSGQGQSPADQGRQTSAEKEASESDKVPTIGILQYTTVAGLDNCYKGVIQGLEKSGFVDGKTCKIDYQNGQGESETNDLIASNFASSGYDLVIAIATPSAASAYTYAKNAAIPVIFCAVSDPVSAGLVKSLAKPETGCSGTTDNINCKAQLEMIRAFQPEAKKIGILYTTSEPNSPTQVKSFEELAGDYGFEIDAVGISDASELAAAAASIVGDGIDCINVITDNNVMNNFSVVTNVTDKAGIPCYGAEESHVADYGCVASETLDYISLGEKTGKMAADVLKGADIQTMEVQIISDSMPVYNAANMAKFHLTLPKGYEDAEQVGK